MGGLDELVIRQAAMHWLDDVTASGSRAVRQRDVARFPFGGESIALLGQQGICKPRQLSAALSIHTTWTSPTGKPPYDDVEGPDGLVRYAYQGQDPQRYDNVGLRLACQERLPVVYFIAVEKGVYLARYPVYVVADEPEHLRVALALDDEQRYVGEPGSVDEDRRRSVLRLTKLRLHQPVFRAQVLGAYERSCAMCRLRHAELLDAAHIIADGRPRGTPVVPNGMALCSIHHRAFDANVVGVRPDLQIEVRRDILKEVDGPMLRHGLQEMDGMSIAVPRHRAHRPDPSRLEERYEEFRAAG